MYRDKRNCVLIYVKNNSFEIVNLVKCCVKLTILSFGINISAKFDQSGYFSERIRLIVSWVIPKNEAICPNVARCNKRG